MRFAEYLSPGLWSPASPAASAPWSIRGKGLADPSHGLGSGRPPYNAYYRANFPGTCTPTRRQSASHVGITVPCHLLTRHYKWCYEQ
ncbi:hypothetical protein VZT92_015208 [Zoarces viviparus]|uniref:Uncharacterized protein n=1 Tax=Zoarces viviparus TaxID=48416 RepID=A0AAW1EVQ5_ZOAVI